MSIDEAVNLLMREWGADESFRSFFTRIVEDYMGTAHNILASDIENIRGILNKMR